MNWYYHIVGEHVRVRVFMDGGYRGQLTFTRTEFEEVKSRCLAHLSPVKMFVNQNAK